MTVWENHFNGLYDPSMSIKKFPLIKHRHTLRKKHISQLPTKPHPIIIIFHIHHRICHVKYIITTKWLSTACISRFTIKSCFISMCIARCGTYHLLKYYPQHAMHAADNKFNRTLTHRRNIICKLRKNIDNAKFHCE